MRKCSVALAYLFLLLSTAPVQAQPWQAQDKAAQNTQGQSAVFGTPPQTSQAAPDFATALPPGSVTPQSQYANETGPIPRMFDAADDWVKWIIGGVVLFIAWGVIRALGRGVKRVSKVAVGAAIDVAPTARQVANRVGSTAAQRTKGFFAETRKCPHCAELIKKEAKVCRFCQRPVL